MMYRYDYVDGIGRYYHRASASASYGATIHQALQGFHEAGGTAAESAEALVARALAAWRSAGYESAADEAARKVLAGDILRRYYDQAAGTAGARRLFATEKQLNLDMGDFVLVGRIDRIDEHVETGLLEIIDYKWG